MGTNLRWLAVPIVLLTCSPAWSALITDWPYAGTDAGSVDPLIGYGRTSNSNLSTELGFFNYFSLKNYDLASTEQICSSAAECDAIIFGTDSVGAYAIGLPEEPAYYQTHRVRPGGATTRLGPTPAVLFFAWQGAHFANTCSPWATSVAFARPPHTMTNATAIAAPANRYRLGMIDLL